MPTITFASPKGGVGRTTAAITLATTLARSYQVTLIDTDQEARLLSWSQKAPLPGSLQVQGTRGRQYIQKEIAVAKSHVDFVILDLEGITCRLNNLAMGMSDVVIIPMGDEQQDAEAAIDTLNDLALVSRSWCREIPVRILFNRTKKISKKTELAASINRQVRARAISFTVELCDLPAFAWLHHMGGTLYELDP